MTHKLRMPNAARDPTTDEVEHRGTVVIVGSNGSGKTRLGAWFENPYVFGSAGSEGTRTAYRIAAQRTISFPSEVQRVGATQANDQFVRGNRGPSRIEGDPVVGQSNDFTPLLNLLYAKLAKEHSEYFERGIQTGGKPGQPPEGTLEKLKRVWESVFVERKLVLGDHRIDATASGVEYTATGLSDGERVGFYLIGQALLAPNDSRLVIDEPELHLHQSIQSNLWDAIEALREDCTFIYITHDLGFAASRLKAPKIVLFDYIPPNSASTPGTWDWTIAPNMQDIPEDVVLRILGSRRPTIFVEGVTGGLDQELYDALFPDRFIVPSGGWENVDRSVRTFRRQGGLHHLSVSGIIDRDDLDDDEVSALSTNGIYALPVACAENLLVMGECMAAVADVIVTDDGQRDARVSDAKMRVVTAMKSSRGLTISQRAQHRVRRKIGAVTCTGITKTDLAKAVMEAATNASAEAAFDAAQNAVDSALNQTTTEAAFEAILKVFRNKAILHAVAGAFFLTGEQYRQEVLSLVRDKSGTLRSLIRSKLPSGI